MSDLNKEANIFLKELLSNGHNLDTLPISRQAAEAVIQGNGNATNDEVLELYWACWEDKRERRAKLQAL